MTNGNLTVIYPPSQTYSKDESKRVKWWLHCLNMSCLSTSSYISVNVNNVPKSRVYVVDYNNCLWGRVVHVCLCVNVITTIDGRQSHLCQEFLTECISLSQHKRYITSIEAIFSVFHGLNIGVYGLFWFQMLFGYNLFKSRFER